MSASLAPPPYSSRTPALDTLVRILTSGSRNENAENAKVAKAFLAFIQEVHKHYEAVLEENDRLRQLLTILMQEPHSTSLEQRLSRLEAQIQPLRPFIQRVERLEQFYAEFHTTIVNMQQQLESIQALFAMLFPSPAATRLDYGF